MINRAAQSKHIKIVGALIVLSATLLSPQIHKVENNDTLKIEIGRSLYFDKTLSEPDGQACSVCHAPKTSFSDPDHAVVSEGMMDGAFVSRNSQSLAYVRYIPPLTLDSAGNYHGGLFWDGRANTLEEQLAGPLFNAAEMNNPDTAAVTNAIRKADYYKDLLSLYGNGDDHHVYVSACDAIAAFERSEYLSEFSSKFDFYLAGKIELHQHEKKGFDLFQGKAGCIKCHSMTPESDGRILFTDYSYHNIGVPKNPNNPFYTTSPHLNKNGTSFIDLGLGITTHDSRQNGKFRVPTLRNVQYTGPYFHNGYFKTLHEVVHFLNTRDHGDYEAPEVKSNVAHQFTGSLQLTAEEEDAIVAFLLTLSDGFTEE